MRTFEQVWAEKEAAGYRYGEDALEQVRFGWRLHEEETQFTTYPWVAGFLNRRYSVVAELKKLAGRKPDPQALVSIPAARLLEWARRLEVPTEYDKPDTT
jgi:hypothetical protein